MEDTVIKRKFFFLNRTQYRYNFCSEHLGLLLFFFGIRTVFFTYLLTLIFCVRISGELVLLLISSWLCSDHFQCFHFYWLNGIFNRVCNTIRCMNHNCWYCVWSIFCWFNNGAEYSVIVFSTPTPLPICATSVTGL